MEINKQHLRDLKQATIKKLQAIDVLSYNLHKCDERLNTYTLKVQEQPENHNLYDCLAVLRFFDFLNKYEFRIERVQAFYCLYENLKFTGKRGLTYYELTDVQAFQFANIYGFYTENGRRLIREALLFVPRKFSKTTSVAAIAIEDLLLGDNNAQAYVAANSYDQAKICFDVIRDILKAHDKKLTRFKINREAIFSRIKGRTSFARCLASDASKLDGLNASTVIVDEFSQAKNAELRNVLTSSMGVRENPLTIVITTASENIDGTFYNELQHYKRILRGEVENDRVFAHIFEPDVDDDEADEKTWRKVQPHYGITIDLEFYPEEYKKALSSSENMMTFRTKLLNMFVKDGAKTWITHEDIFQRFKNIDIDNLTERYPCMCAVDLSVCDDFSTVTYVIYNESTRSFHSHTDYYLPRGTIKKHPNREMYMRWEEEGYLIVLEGEVIDYRHITNDILRRNKKLLILQIGYDKYKSLEFINILSAAGARDVITAVSQTYGTFTSPVESFEIAVFTNKITFNKNPITAYCFSNALIDEDKLQNRKPIKRKLTDKIDATITNIMCFYLFNNYER